MPARQASPCVLCREIVDVNDAAITLTVMIRTVGIREDDSSSESGQGYMCADCATSFALGKIPPPSQPLTMLAHQLISRKVAKGPSVLIAAWQRLRRSLEMPPAHFQISEGEVMPPSKRLAG